MKIPSIITALAAVTMVTSGYAQQTPNAPAAEQVKTPTPEQFQQNVGYLLGYQTGQMLREIPTLSWQDINSESFLKGMKDGLTRQQPAFSPEELEKIQAEIEQVFQKRVQEIAAKNLEDGEKFLAENAKKEGVVTLPSGLQYKIIAKGDGEKYDAAKFPDPLFQVKYKGTLINGTVFDDTHGQAVELPLRVIPGFEEALRLMPVGAHWIIYIPSKLAYGDNPPAPPIAPNSVLIFDLQLDGIKEAPATQQVPPLNISPEQLQQMLQNSQN